MKVKIQRTLSKDIIEEEIKPIFECHHVQDTELYDGLMNVQFDVSTKYILVENKDCAYGFSTLWLKDKKNEIYEWEGFGHSGAASVICALLQENQKLKKQNKSLLKEVNNLAMEIDHV